MTLILLVFLGGVLTILSPCMTYVGYGRAQNFSSAGGFAQDRPKDYLAPDTLALNHWALAGSWAVDSEKAMLRAAPGKIVFR
jgi:hypothetical protein